MRCRGIQQPYRLDHSEFSMPLPTAEISMRTTLAQSAKALLLALALLPFAVSAVDMEVAHDLSDLGRMARDKQVVILISVTQEYCPYCHKIKEEILNPMLLSGEYGDKVLIRELSIDPGVAVTDFDGRPRMAEDFAYERKVWVTPTLLFLGPDGAELSPRMLGVQTVEMYGYYVDESIDHALKRLRDPASRRYQPTDRDIGAWPDTWDDLSH